MRGRILDGTPDTPGLASSIVVQAWPAPATPFALDTADPGHDALLQQTARLVRTIGSVNIILAGQTGVGKSTLLNSVFGERIAKTASGRPVTQHAEWFQSDTVPLRLLDTRGLEAKDYTQTLEGMRGEIEACRAQPDAGDQLHMAWVCISAPSNRVQDCDVDVVRFLNRYEIPALVVLTKYDQDPEMIDDVQQVMAERKAHILGVVPVHALVKKHRASFGLEDLVHATYTALPAAHRAAFAAAQRVNREINRAAAEEFISTGVGAAASAAVIPIPFADAATLAPIQAGMLVGISQSYGLEMERKQIMQLMSAVLGFMALNLAGRWAVGTALKFIPGPGTVIGAVLNAGLAGSMTRSLGKTYSDFLYNFLETNRRVPTPAEVFDSFPEFFRANR